VHPHRVQPCRRELGRAANLCHVLGTRSCDGLDTCRASLAEALSSGLDEAYFEYVHNPKVVSGVVLHRLWPNLVALRTFSKAYGLAGRAGQAVVR
jgi:hypothetical protein